MNSASRPKTAIIGRGNVAVHLAGALSRQCDTVLVNPHTLEELPLHPDVCIIAVSDNAIGEVAARLRHLDAIVAHTSGTTPMQILADAGCPHPGVLYPLQTFSRDVELDYSAIPVFVEGATPDIEWILSDIARSFTAKIYHADSDRRRRLHMASVFGCNFTNHMWTLAARILEADGIPFDTLRPLIAETVAKLDKTSPLEAQTGPARRHDTKTTEAHLSMLRQDSDMHDIYQLLTQSISKTYSDDNERN